MLSTDFVWVLCCLQSYQSKSLTNFNNNNGSAFSLILLRNITLPPFTRQESELFVRTNHLFGMYIMHQLFLLLGASSINLSPGYIVQIPWCIIIIYFCFETVGMDIRRAHSCCCVFYRQSGEATRTWRRSRKKPVESWFPGDSSPMRSYQRRRQTLESSLSYQ